MRMFRSLRPLVLVPLVAMTVIPAGRSGVSPGPTEGVTVDSAGNRVSGSSGGATLGGGRYVAFDSHAWTFLWRYALAFTALVIGLLLLVACGGGPSIEPGADLSHRDLSGRDLTQADLTGADLRGATLNGVILSGAKLGETNLNNADLTGANLTGADLAGADINGAALAGANLSNANLSNASLIRAGLSGADLTGSDLSGADLGGAVLTNANVSNVNLGHAKLTSVNLRGFDLSGLNLSESQLINADLRDADLRDANLSGANLSGAKLTGADFTGADLSGANLAGVGLGGASLKNASLKRTNLRGQDLSGANLVSCDLTGADLSDANLAEADLGHANLSGANLSNVNLSDVRFGTADLTSANLTGATLDRAQAVDVVGLTDDMLNSAASLIRTELDSEEEIAAALKPACGAGGVERAAAYTPGPGLHPVVLLTSAGEPLSSVTWDVESTASLPADWLPTGMRFVELVACIEESRQAIETCAYTGPSITRYQYYLVIKLMAARTGQTVATETLRGDPPRQCQFSETYNLTELGVAVTGVALVDWLRPFVAP